MTHTARILTLLGALLLVATFLVAGGLCCAETADACHRDGEHAPEIAAWRAPTSTPATAIGLPVTYPGVEIASSATTRASGADGAGTRTPCATPPLRI